MNQIDDFLKGKTTKSSPQSIDDFLGAKPKKKQPDRSFSDQAADVGKSVAGSVLSAVGAIPTAGGRLVREGSEMLLGLSMDEARTLAEAEGRPDKALEYYERSNKLNPVSKLGGAIESAGGWLAEKGNQVRDSRSEAAKELARQSTPEGDITKPGTWTMGKAPSVEGAAHVLSDVVGSVAPQVATTIATRGRSAATQVKAGGAVGAAQIGGAAIQEANEYLSSFTDDKLRQASPVFRELEAKGYSPEDARTIITREAENRAAAFAAPVGMAGGSASSAILGKTGERIAGGFKGIGAKAAVLGALGATEEGIQEVGEGVATRAGINDATGMDRSLTEGTFGEFVLGAAGGAGMGSTKGAVQGIAERFTQTGDARPQPAPGPLPGSITNVAQNADQSAQRVLSEQTLEQQRAAAAATPFDQIDANPQKLPQARLAELEIQAQTMGLNSSQVNEMRTLLEGMQAENSELATAGFEQQSREGLPSAVDPVSAEGWDAGSMAAPEQAAQTVPMSNFWTYAKTRGYTPAQLRLGTPAHTALKAEFDAIKAAAVTRQASIMPTAQTGQAMAPADPFAGGAQVTSQDLSLQNRDRSRTASVVQMQDIASRPDYMRLGPSRSPDAGAPMVFAVGDDVSMHITESNAGRMDVAVMADGQRVPFRYAVVEASSVQPSNFADGNINPLFAETEPGTLKALNNGRTAGLRAAYERGSAESYRQELMADVAAHGVPVDAIARTPNPVLVRVYSEASNTLDMAAKSQGQGLGMSPGELARQDAPLIDASVLAVYQSGDVTSAANRDFVRAFVGKLLTVGQDVATLMTAEGSLSPAGRQRIQAALVQAAYGDTDLVQEMFDSTDSDIKAIGEALKFVAGEWANMRDSASTAAIDPRVDITGNLIQAVHLIRKSRQDRTSLVNLVNQPDLMTGEPPDALTVGVLRLLYTGRYFTRPLGRDKVIDGLQTYVRGAMSTSASSGLFGDSVTVSEILATINPQGETNVQSQNPESQYGTEGRSDSGRSAAQEREQGTRFSDDQGRAGAGAYRQGERENAAGTTGPSNAQTAQSDDATGFALTAPTPAEIEQRQQAASTAARQAEQKIKQDDQRNQADADRETFTLTGSNRDADVAEARGQQGIFSRSQAGTMTVASVKQAVDSVTGKWARPPQIEVVANMQDLRVPESARKEDARQRLGGAVGVPRGIYSKGTIYLVADGLRNERDAAEVLFHEALGHYGIRAVFGTGLDPILDQLATARPDLMKPKAAQYGKAITLDQARAFVLKENSDLAGPELDAAAAKLRHLHRLEVAEEVLAEMAEKNPQLGYVRRTIAAIRSWLRANVPTFKDVQLTDAEIINSFILPARGWVEQGKLKTVPTGRVALARQDPEFRFNRHGIGDGEPAVIGQAQQNAWTEAKASAMKLTKPETINKLIYEFQDKYIDLKNLRGHIKAIGGTISDLNDAYLGEELFHKRLAKRTEDFLDKELRPLLAEMRANAVSMEEFEKFLHARHAPEANCALAERNPNQDMIQEGRKKVQASVRDLEIQMQRATTKGSAIKALTEALDQAKQEAATWNSAQPFRGDETARMALSGMSDQDAQAHMGSLTPAKKAHMLALAAKVDAIQGKTLDTLEDYGLMDKATLNAWRKSYKHYVPLHRDEAHADSDRHPTGQGFSVKGQAAKRRVGSGEAVTNILAHIAMQREAALTRGEKNHVVKKLYLMAAQNPAYEYWQVDAPPQIKTIDSRTGFVQTMVDPSYKNLPNVVMVRIGGRDQAIVFNEHNKDAVRLAQAMKNLDIGDLHVVLGLAAKGTRWFASVNTQYNPILGLINFARDVQSGLLNLSTTELAGLEKDVASKIPTAMRAIYRERRGKSATSRQWSKLWEEFQNVGGTTGYRDLFTDANDRANALTKELAALDRGEVSKVAHAVVDWLSDYNETMENAVRLAAYQVALDKGMNKERAASLAKNLTVNFNRKGRQAREIGALYAFFNAAIQGTVRMAETLKGPMGRKIMYGGVMLGAVNAMIGMAVMGGGDADEPDRWEQVPEFIKERSIVIPLGRQDYLSIPMPLGFHVLPNIGRLAVEFAMGGKDKTAGRQLGKLLQVLADAFNPLGGSQNLGQMVAPTVIDPIVALMQNRDWTGKPIYRENNNPLDPQPGHKMAKDFASTPSRAIAEAINKITGGTDYRPGAWSPTPEQLDYVIGQLTGGLGRELLKVNQTISATVTGDELPPYKIPLVGRLYGNTRGPAGQSEKYYENVKLLNEIENEYKGRLRNREDVNALRDSEPLVRLIGLGNGTENQVRKLREMRRRLVERKDPGYQERAKEIDVRIGEAMERLNAEVSKVTNGDKR